MKPFKPLLAVEANLETLRYPCYVSPKLDGIRVLILDGKAVTRNLKPVPNRYIRETLEAHADVLNNFDGEIVVGGATAKDCFNKTSSAVMSFEGEPNFTYYVFDRVAEGSYVDRWDYGASMDDLYENNLPEFVIPIAQLRVENMIELDFYEELFVSKGYEGVMTRSPEGHYKFGRSTAKEQILLKIKRFSDAEAVIVDFDERLHNGNEAITNALGHTERSSHKDNMVPMGTLGALVVKCDDFEDTFKIGTGFDDETRKQIWDNRESYLGKLVKFKYQKCGVKDKPRFPVYLGVRYEFDLDLKE